MFRAVVVGILISMGSSSQAGLITGNTLLAECQSEGRFCQGYISGSVDEHLRVANINWYISFQTNAQATLQEHLSYCIADGVTIGQMKDIVTLYLERNPADRHQDASWLVVGALAEAFPCER